MVSLVAPRLARVSFWLIVATHGLFALAGVGIAANSAFGSRSGVGEDWSVVVGGTMVLLTIIGLVACAPALINLRRLCRDRSRPATAATLFTLSLPVFPLAIPGVRPYAVLLVVAASATTVPLLIYLIQFAVHLVVHRRKS